MISVGGKKLLPITLGVMPYWYTFLIAVSLMLQASGASLALIVGVVCIIVAGIVLLDSYYLGKERSTENSQSLSDDRRFEIFTGVASADPQNPKEVHVEKLRRSLAEEVIREERRKVCRLAKIVEEERAKRICH